MAMITTLCLVAVIAVCNAGLLPGALVSSHFPNLNTVYHGHGATSYQNVQVQSYGSVPIPKDLQVDDGHSYDLYAHQEIPAAFEFHSLEDSHASLNHPIISSKASYTDGSDHIELPPHYDPSHYELYDHHEAAEYEYH